MDMPNLAPSDSRVGPLNSPRKVPEPSISQWRLGVASNSKIRCGVAGTNCDTETILRAASWARDSLAGVLVMSTTLGECASHQFATASARKQRTLRRTRIAVITADEHTIAEGNIALGVKRWSLFNTGMSNAIRA